MSHKPESAALHIARRHQSAPAKHYAETAIEKAAIEIHEGRWIPETDEPENALNNLGLALGAGTNAGGVEMGGRPALEDFIRTREMNQLGQHPRVLEAMERMALEIETEKDDERLIEMSWAMWEENARRAVTNHWEGQERWQVDAEQMRYGVLMTPEAFMQKLETVIGRGRLLRGSVEVRNPGAKSFRVGIVIRNPTWNGQKPPGELPQKQAQDLADEARKIMHQVKGLRATGNTAEADKLAVKAYEMSVHAGGLKVEAMHAQITEPEFIRVATLQGPLGTEWMVMKFDEYGVPVEPHYLGWRTALLTLIRRRLITEEKAHKAFPVSSGIAANWYLEQLQMFRNTGIGLVH